MDPGSGDLGDTGYSGLPGNTVGMATMVDMSEASKQKSEIIMKIIIERPTGVPFQKIQFWNARPGGLTSRLLV